MFRIYQTPSHVFNYDEIPPGYYYDVMVRGGAVQRFWHQKKFSAVSKKIQTGETVLDLGCGPGSFLSILAKENPNVRAIGLDIASDQIDFASQKIAPQFDGRVQFQTYDPKDRRLPFPDASFDVITSIEVIEHIHPFLAYKILEDAKRVLKPGGRMIITTPNYSSLWPFIELALEKISPVKYHEQHISRFTPNSLIKFLESVGLEVVQLETLFVIAPFLASYAERFAESILKFESRLESRFGSLLIAEVRISNQYR